MKIARSSALNYGVTRPAFPFLSQCHCIGTFSPFHQDFNVLRPDHTFDLQASTNNFLNYNYLARGESARVDRKE